MCSRASLGNWNVWVHGVQEDPPLHPIAAEQQRNWVVASGSTRFKRMLDVLAPVEVGGGCRPMSRL